MSHAFKILARAKNFSHGIKHYLLSSHRINEIPKNCGTSHHGRSQGFCDGLSSESDDKIPTETPNTKKSSRRKKPLSAQQRHLEKVAAHLHQCNKQLDIKAIPDKYISSSYNRAEGLYVVATKTAETISERVIGDDISTPVFEVNPGMGVVTKALLQKRVREVHAFQLSSWGDPYELQEKNSDRLFLYKHDFFAVWKRLLLDYYDDNDVEAVMSIVKPKPWSEGPPAKIYAAVPGRAFINHMIASLVFQKGFYRLGRLELYLAMRPYDYLYVTYDGPSNYAVYRSAAVLFQIMFERKLLCSLPAKDFIPWIKPLSARRRKLLPELSDADEDCMYLVKVAPRKDLLELVCGVDNLKALWHFVRQSFTLRSNRVIPTLEKWIPGCGPRLIFDNMTIYTEFGELSPPEMLRLFQKFSKWPEYPHCSFLDSMEAYFLKSYIESNPDGINEAEFEAADEDIEVDPDFEAASNSRKKEGQLPKIGNSDLPGSSPTGPCHADIISKLKKVIYRQRVEIHRLKKKSEVLIQQQKTTESNNSLESVRSRYSQKK